MTAVGRPALTARSDLYVPADQPDKVARAAVRGADACILDLDNAVAPTNKGAARAAIGAFLVDAPVGSACPQWWVRINAATAAADIAAVAGVHLTGVMAPKADVDLLAEVHRLLGDAERVHGLPVGSLAVFAWLETAGGVLRAEAVAAAPRVVRLGLGEADLAAELCMRPGPDKVELWPLRARAVLAAAVAGFAPPVDRRLDRLVHASRSSAAGTRFPSTSLGLSCAKRTWAVTQSPPACRCKSGPNSCQEAR